MKNSALAMIGPRDEVKTSFLGHLREARMRADLYPHELACMADLPDQAIVARIEDGKEPLKLDVVQRLMALLGISIDRALPLPKLTAEQIRSWRDQMIASEAGPLAANNGQLEASEEACVRFFLRYQALRELCAE